MPTSNVSPSQPTPGSVNDESLNGFGGWLVLLVLILVLLYPLLTVIGVAANALQVPWVSLSSSITEPAVYWTLCSMVAGLALAFYGVYGGIKLLKIRPGAVRTVKIFLVGVLVYNAAMFVLTLIAEHRTKTKLDSAVTAELRNVVFALLWYLYLELSKRVATTYAK